MKAVGRGSLAVDRSVDLADYANSIPLIVVSCRSFSITAA